MLQVTQIHFKATTITTTTLVAQNPTAALEKFKKPDSSKVVIRFRAIGNAPILKQLNYKINAANKFQAVIKFLRKELNYKTSDPLFVYINSAFSPAPDEIVANLFKCFSTDGRQLIVNYCTTAAWG
ncbi:15993_t:CDS:2 [Entrophospora sp. SA101]|nr:301_t:CDS:2 [Entrophospora sp. SA101]CAJ0647603.1 9708_t:CDS:2 [Entrophospora sp. SA101]CAJ0751509.1 5293_t:CDS:2 [Entrophospora sp. SA101]CAJ0760690.1 15993_t:CDS:2 [Entrophospora sp. SA101]CAJ0912329.1 22188_t:CDS:2 [Entrophospora sp. SA101]